MSCKKSLKCKCAADCITIKSQWRNYKLHKFERLARLPDVRTVGAGLPVGVTMLGIDSFTKPWENLGLWSSET